MDNLKQLEWLTLQKVYLTHKFSDFIRLDKGNYGTLVVIIN